MMIAIIRCLFSRVEHSLHIVVTSLVLVACAQSATPTLDPAFLTSDPGGMLTPDDLTLTAVPTAEPPTVTPDEPEPPRGECFRHVTVEVYADLDGDAIRDADEPPLAGILVGILSQNGEVEMVNDAETDSDGRADLGFITTAEDCHHDYLVGVLVAPAGYTFPDEPLRRFGDVWETHEVAQFGLLVENAASNGN